MKDDPWDFSPENHENERGGPVQFRYNWSQTTPTEAVIASVAKVTDRDQLDLVPLQYVVKTRELDAILRESQSNALRITFDYQGLRILVDTAGLVRVGPSCNG